ncbi:type II secretion system F family protein [Nanoarchaeota archaeon]
MKLLQAKIPDSPEEYVRRTLITSFFLSFALCVITFMFLKNPLIFLLIPVVFIPAFAYMIRTADLKIEHVKKEINKEIVYAGRFLIIELESGVPIYTAFSNISDNYDNVGKYFADVVRDVDFGTTLEDALNNSIAITPSPQLRKIMWQILNSLKTGADVTASLNAVLDQIVREQQIQVKEYGRKLNPMAMFYMMIAIIVPSLGTTMVVVMATFVGFSLPMVGLLLAVAIVAFIQFMFLAFIKSSRPPMAL